MSKFHPITGHEDPEGVEGYRYSSTLSLTSALDGVGAQRNAPEALPLWKDPETHCTGGWVALGPDWTGVRKMSHPPGFDPRTVQPVAGRYTD